MSVKLADPGVGPGEDSPGLASSAPVQAARCKSDDLLSEYARSRDLATRNELVLRYEPLARFAASRFAPAAPHSSEDLLQVARVGLVSAVERFDPSVGVVFRTFALPTILGAVKHYLRDHSWMVKPPRMLRTLGLRIRRLNCDLERRTGRPPTVVELAEAAGVGEELLVRAMEIEHLYQIGSLDIPISDEDGRALGSLGERIGATDARLFAFEQRSDVQHALTRLEQREQAVLYHRFFESATQAETGRRLGISQMQVSRIERRALGRLRTLL